MNSVNKHDVTVINQSKSKCSECYKTMQLSLKYLINNNKNNVT